MTASYDAVIVCNLILLGYNKTLSVRCCGGVKVQAINGLFEWIDENNQAQSFWALNYLLKLGEGVSNDQYKSPYENLKLSTQSLTVNEYTKETVKKMRGAWSQKKLRDSRVNTKSYNFVLSTKAKNQLTSLNKIHKTTSSATIELLIERGFEYEKEAKEEAKKVVKERLSDIKARANKSADRLHRKSKAILKTELKILGVKCVDLEKRYKALERKYEELEEKCMNP